MCSKKMNNVIVGGYVVCRAVGPRTRVLEYTIQDVEQIGGAQVDPEMD